jgi:hypothetical protein
MNRSTFAPNEEKLYKVDNKTVVLNPDGKTITITYSANLPANATIGNQHPKVRNFTLAFAYMRQRRSG